MTRDEIIKAAREVHAHGYTNRFQKDAPAFAFGIEQLERFAALVEAQAAAREREQCEAECRAVAQSLRSMHAGTSAEVADSCGDMIRALGAATGVQP